MSEPEKIKDVPKPPPEQVKEPSAPKTAQSAFDKILEQQKVLQQSPLMQGKVAEQGATEYKVKEIGRQQDQNDEKQKKEESKEEGSREKIKLKEKGSETVTREAVTRGGEKKGFGQGSGGGRGGGGFAGDMAKRHILERKMADSRGLINNFEKGNFASKLTQANAAAATLKPQQMQALVNQIVAAIRVGKNGLGWPELSLLLRENVFSGLRLRFTSKHGKVSIQFETANRAVKALFDKEAPKIREALVEKGVAVEDINVS